MNEPDHLRVADADRQLVEQVLGRAYAEGRITQEEHAARLEQVWAARTFGELRPLTADLVAVADSVQAELIQPPADGHERAIVDLHNPQTESDRISAIMSSNKRMDMPWRLREHVNVSTVMGEIHLDLRNAVFESNVINIHANCVMGEVKLFVPAGVRVSNETTPMLGEVKLKGLIPEDTGPLLRLDGMVLMGEIDVLGPNHRSNRRRRNRSR